MNASESGSASLNASEFLGLNAEAVRTTATVHGGYANALELMGNESEQSQEHNVDIAMVHASSLLRAASFLAIIDQDGARKIFQKAARAYASLHKPFSVILAICSGSRDISAEIASSVLREPHAIDATEPLARFYSSALLNADNSEWNSPHEFAPVGRLRIPFGTYNSLLSYAREEPSRAIRRYLDRVTEPLMAASADQYHWRRHYRAVLPLEPEIMAPLIGLAWQGIFRPDHLREVKIRPMARAIAEVSLALAGKREPQREKSI